MTHSHPPLKIDELVVTAESHRSCDCRPYGDRAHVLFDVDGQSRLLDVPTAVCCPNCGDAVAIYECGLPEVVPYFDTGCEHCGVDLRSWCAVAVDAAYLQVVEPSTLTQMVQRFWDIWLWSGITNSKNEPRNDEYTSRFDAKATAFGWDWTVTCPLCGRSLTELERESAIAGGDLDYHHWSHNPDQGICLCRECHDIIGFDTYDTDLEERAASWGFDSRHDLQIIRLALREAVVTGCPVGPWRAAEIVKRYNLPQSPVRVSELLQAVRTNTELQDAFIDMRLVAGISQ